MTELMKRCCDCEHCKSEDILTSYSKRYDEYMDRFNYWGLSGERVEDYNAKDCTAFKDMEG